MKKAIIIIATLLIMPSVIFAKSNKRGVGENLFQYWAQMEVLEPGVTWYYNWGNTEKSSVEGQEFLEYVPMCWNGGYNAEAIREYCKNHPETKYLLGFNEPNFKDQANMTPAEAAAKWPEVQALAKEFNLELVAPALNYSPDAPYYQPTAWMDEFVNLVGKDAFDYTAIHAYGGFGVMSDLATTFYEKYGKPVWVTEFCFWPGESGGVSVASQVNMIVQSLEWLEKTDFIYRYAWFKATEKTATNFNLVNSGKGEEPRELSEQGLVYVNMSEFDPEVYHPINVQIPAKEYISQSLISLGSSADAASGSPIEISQFNSGATLDYQFDVPSAGEHQLTLRVSGVGEPARFDPKIGVLAINEDGSDGAELCEAKQFGLPGDDETYQTVTFPITLSAGKQTIRLKDYAPYQPSGIRISTVSLVNPAGIKDIHAMDSNTPVNVYNLQGVCVLRNVMPGEVAGKLSKGLYIINGSKILLK
ncbi:MAG: hypothetical protein J1D77_02970 [Muribaculaceae bacterium]|nr:hypothetical protein [Muribaculaceae bacterium]